MLITNLYIYSCSFFCCFFVIGPTEYIQHHSPFTQTFHFILLPPWNIENTLGVLFQLALPPELLTPFVNPIISHPFLSYQNWTSSVSSAVVTLAVRFEIVPENGASSLRFAYYFWGKEHGVAAFFDVREVDQHGRDSVAPFLTKIARGVFCGVVVVWFIGESAFLKGFWVGKLLHTQF